MKHNNTVASTFGPLTVVFTVLVVVMAVVVVFWDARLFGRSRGKEGFEGGSYGGDLEDVVDKVFMRVLNRYPSNLEQADYVRLLDEDQLSPADIDKILKETREYRELQGDIVTNVVVSPVQSTAKSVEKDERTVDSVRRLVLKRRVMRIYAKVLNRTPTEKELDGYFRKLEKKRITEADIARELRESDSTSEDGDGGRGRYVPVDNAKNIILSGDDKSHDAYLERLHRDVMGYDPTDAELAALRTRFVFLDGDRSEMKRHVSRLKRQKLGSPEASDPMAMEEDNGGLMAVRPGESHLISAGLSVDSDREEKKEEQEDDPTRRSDALGELIDIRNQALLENQFVRVTRKTPGCTTPI